MKMGLFFRNRRVLKLVHPGGFAEIHKNPISAAEVMKKNPRHFITRPDVFRFPWIVIRPESILKPGNVFFIVPYHTVHRLLQTTKSQIQASPQQQPDQFPPGYHEICPEGSWAEQEVMWANDDGLIHFPRKGDSIESSVETRKDFHLLLEKQSLPISQARPKVDCRFEDEDDIFPTDLVDSNINQFLEQYLDEQSVGKAYFEVKTQQHFDDYAKKQSLPISQARPKVDCRFEDEDDIFPTDSIDSNINQFLELCLNEQSLGKAHFEVKTQQHFDDYPKKRYPAKYCPVVSAYKNPLNESRSSFSSQSTSSDAEIVVPLTKDDHGGLDISSFEEEKRLKSCLKKNKSTKMRNFRVKFILPDGDEKS